MRHTPWPHRMKAEVGSYPGAGHVIRDMIDCTLRDWGMCGYYQTARMVASELINNAVQATEGLEGHMHEGKVVPGRPPIRFFMRGDGTQLLIEIWDASPRMPVKKEPTEHDERGRGLVIVDELAERWGHFLPDNDAVNSGKVVFAHITQPLRLVAARPVPAE